MQSFERIQRNQSVFNHPNSQTYIIGGARSPIKFVQRAVKISANSINNNNEFEHPKCEIANGNESLTMKRINEEFQIQSSIDFCDSYKKFEFISMNQGLVKLQRPFVNGRSLSEIILSGGAQSNIIASLHVARIVISIVEQLHNKGHILKNLKAENVFFSDGKLYLVDCFFDFMFEETLLNTNSIMSLLCRGPESSEKPSKQLDIFHFGLLCYLLCFGRLPWMSMNHGRIYKDMVNEEIPFPEIDFGTCSDLNFVETNEILKKCFRANPEERPTAAEVHSLIRDVIDNSGETSSDILQSIRRPNNLLFDQKDTAKPRMIRTSTSYLSNIDTFNNLLLNKEENILGGKSNNPNQIGNGSEFSNYTNNNDNNNNNIINTCSDAKQLTQPRKTMYSIRSNAALPQITLQTITQAATAVNSPVNTTTTRKRIGITHSLCQLNCRFRSMSSGSSDDEIGTNNRATHAAAPENSINTNHMNAVPTTIRAPNHPPNANELNNNFNNNCNNNINNNCNNNINNNCNNNIVNNCNNNINNSECNDSDVKHNENYNNIPYDQKQSGNLIGFRGIGLQQRSTPGIIEKKYKSLNSIEQQQCMMMFGAKPPLPIILNKVSNSQTSINRDGNNKDNNKERRGRSNSNSAMLNSGVVNAGGNRRIVNNNVNVNQLKDCKRMFCSAVNFAPENNNVV